MQRPDSKHTTASTDTASDWGIWYGLDEERFWALLGLVVLAGGLLLLGAPSLNPQLFPDGNGGHLLPLLSILLVVAAAGAYGLRTIHPQVALLWLTLAVAGLVGYALSWGLPIPFQSVLLLPVIVAIVLLPPLSSCVLSLFWFGSLLALIRLGAPVDVTVVRMMAVLAAALWLLAGLAGLARTDLLRSYQHYFTAARDTLESARDDRQKLNELNADLVNAFLQLERLNRLLQASRLEAEMARRAKEEFVANVSHELRTPLNMIIGFTEMILHAPSVYGAQLPAALLGDMGVIYRNSQHLSQLINDVLALSQAEAGEITLSRSWVAVEEVVREAVQAVAPLYKAKGLRLTTVIPAEFPPVFCDRLRVRQVLLNLLSNAGRYTAAGTVTVRLHAEGNQAIFQVADTGPGIPPEEQKRIFEPFTQMRQPHQAHSGGSGLGLSICKQLVKLHDGQIWLDSTVGVGSTFTFALPFNSHATVPVDNPTRWIDQNYVAGERRSLLTLPRPLDRLLVLDKERTLSSYIEKNFTDLEVVTVDSVEALEAALRTVSPIALLINDVDVMGDNTFSRRFAALPMRLPIISCYVPGKEAALADLNLINYLVKPVLRDDLLHAVAQSVPPGSAILLAEDDLALARLFRRQLDSVGLGYRILHATDGASALRFLRERRPDLLLLDLGLPDLDGYQLLHAKNSDAALAAIPVMVVSARNPIGEPVVAGRLRVELVGGLSLRDIAQSIKALQQALSPLRRSTAATSPETVAE